MKFITLLFNLYLLVLPCIPCGDVDDCANENSTTLSLQKENNPKEEHKKDDCTPFCHCGCCTTSYYYQINSKEKAFTKAYTIQKFTLLDEVFISNNINIIWQPPKAQV
jgi:formate dehydrogenase assembly factor FdhD